MRVISGSKRGMKLNAPEGDSTRPTTDRIKENLFNILAFELQDCTFLDLFSGSGAVGIEALSRGSNQCYFVESDVNAVEIIKQNLARTGLQEKAVIMQKDVFTAMENLGNENKKFDIIFLDPPYDMNLESKVLDNIKEYNLLNGDGIVIIEHSTKNDIINLKGYNLYKNKKYGKISLSFYELLED